MEGCKFLRGDVLLLDLWDKKLNLPVRGGGKPDHAPPESVLMRVPEAVWGKQANVAIVIISCVVACCDWKSVVCGLGCLDGCGPVVLCCCCCCRRFFMCSVLELKSFVLIPR